jgi:uncharacterized protein YaaN involved in tellurite resistance
VISKGHLAVATPLRLPPAEQLKLSTTIVAQTTAGLLSNPVGSDSFERAAETIRRLGTQELRESNLAANAVLDRGGPAARSSLSRGIVALKKTLHELDPREAAHGRVLERLPLIGPVLRRFGTPKPTAPATVLKAITADLLKERDELEREIVSIEAEEENLVRVSRALIELQFIADELDAQISAAIAEREAAEADDSGHELVATLKRDLLYGIRQRRLDITNHLAVCTTQRAMLAVARRTSEELVLGIERTTTTGIAAARSALMTKSVVEHQRHVARELDELGSITEQILLEASSDLVTTAREAKAHASGPAVSSATLRKLFDNAYLAFDELERFRTNALPRMESDIMSMQADIMKRRASASA